jgi:hypothetical protein
MSKRTRTPKPKPDTAEVTALRAALVDASIATMNTFSDAVEAAKKTGSLRQEIIVAKDRLAALDKRAAETQYAQDADDAHDAGVRLAKLEQAKEAAWQKSLAMTEAHLAVAKLEDAARMALDAAIAKQI